MNVINTNNKYIYVVFSSTPTFMGKLIRTVTGVSYNHVSVALDNTFKTMYSFARYNKYSPLVGGLVEEESMRYLYNEDKHVEVRILEIPVSLEEYNDIKEKINEMLKNKEIYIYNTFSAIAYPFNKKIEIKDSYTCIEFTIKILENLNLVDGDTHVETIQSLLNFLDKYCIYEGDFLKVAEKNDEYDVNFFKRKSPLRVLIDTMRHFEKLTVRCVVDRNNHNDMSI